MVKTRIVVIEDDTDLREAMCLMLHVEGHHVSGFSSAKEAIQRIEDGLPVDVILLDLMMPIMTGWEFCEYRARSTTLTKVPVIVVTARRSVTPPIGASDVLLKPFDPEALLEAIARVVSGSSVADGTATA
jgi:CheY-like chemotaxis protein